MTFPMNLAPPHPKENHNELVRLHRLFLRRSISR
jgi:hypothetical protein